MQLQCINKVNSLNILNGYDKEEYKFGSLKLSFGVFNETFIHEHLSTLLFTKLL